MELVTGHGEDPEAVSTVAGLECIQPTVLPDLASVHRDVNHQRQLPAELGHRKRRIVVDVP